jgi:hypothetical protein
MPASLHFKQRLRKLNEHQVRYLIVGAYAVMKYTEPRYTKDLDVWVDPTPENATRVFKALADFIDERVGTVRAFVPLGTKCFTDRQNPIR